MPCEVACQPSGAFDKQQVSRTHHKMKVIVTSNYIMNNDERYFTHLKCFFALRLTIDHGPQSNKWGPLSVLFYFLLFYPFGFLVYCTFAALASCQTKPTSLGVGATVCTRRMEPPTRFAGPEFGHSAQVLLPHLQVIWERRHSNSKRLFAYCIYMHILCPLVS